MKTVLVVAVHPDDETLGCGGTLLRHRAEGDAVHWLIVTGISEESGFSRERVAERNAEIDRVATLYGFAGVHRLEIPTTQLEDFSKQHIIQKISTVFNHVKPTVVYLQHPGDVHSEHGAVFHMAFANTKIFRYPFVKEVYTMETLSETEFAAPLASTVFMPNCFVDISAFLERKIEIMQVYKSELGKHPFPRSEQAIRALATLRGSQAGVLYAESFSVMKIIRA